MSPKGMSAELMNELLCSLPFENAFGLLAKMPNGLLARNVQKMIKNIKMVMKENKWNADDCGPKLDIFDGLIAKCTDPNSGILLSASNSVRAVLPIPSLNLNFINKTIIVFYFEVEILTKSEYINDGIGFCCQKFQLKNEMIGWEENSIGIFHKERILIEEFETELKNSSGDFKMGDFVGLGIIHNQNSQMECFVTYNGELLGKFELPSKFAKIHLFPTVNFYSYENSLRANFGKQGWQFKEFGIALK